MIHPSLHGRLDLRLEGNRQDAVAYFEIIEFEYPLGRIEIPFQELEFPLTRLARQVLEAQRRSEDHPVDVARHQPRDNVGVLGTGDGWRRQDHQ